MAMYAQLAPNLDDLDLQPFAKKISGSWKLVLLEEGTCTYRAGQRFVSAAFEEPPEIIKVLSFQQGIEKSKVTRTILLLPHLAIPHVAEMETDLHRITMHDYTFRYSNPPLYLAGRSHDAKGLCAAIIHLENLSLPEDGITGWKNVNNTQEAARACSEGQANLCITNEYGLKKYSLTPIRMLKKMQPTWFAYSWED